MEVEIIIAGILAFIGQVKPGIIGYVTFESYRAWKGQLLTLKGYIVRFITTLGLLYVAEGFTPLLGQYGDEAMFICGGFSFVILDILETKIPGLLNNKANKIFNKNDQG